MVFDKLLSQHAHLAYGHSHHSCHEVHPLDDICGYNHEPGVHYVYVGHCKGRYAERGKDIFDYVGPHRGDHEKELLPRDQTCKHIVAWSVLVFAVLASIAAIHSLLRNPPVDCRVGLDNWERGWSLIKKDWCCSNEGVGCVKDSNEAFGAQPPLDTQGPRIPRWLEMWQPDMDLGAKFIMTVSMALIFGCCSGAFALYILVRYCISPLKSKTEQELMKEVSWLLDRAKVNVPGELSVALMWDSAEDFDLHLVIPTGEEISWQCTQAHGGRLTCDSTGKRLKDKASPVENIQWPPYDHAHPDANPPEGEYEIWVKLCHTCVLHSDANLTIVKTIRGKREIFHHRMVPGTFEKKVCGFRYKAPHSSPGGHR